MKMRSFTPEFKVQIVHAVLSGEKSVVQVCREHNLSDSAVHHWKKLYREQGEAAFMTSTSSRGSAASTDEQEVLALRSRVAELERFIGRQAVEIEILKKVQALTSSASKNGVK